MPFCGLLTHLNYKPNPFSEQFGFNITPDFPVPAGTGLGFDALLAALPWKSL